MKLTIIETGLPPAPLRDRFDDYPAMFRQMMSAVGDYTFETIPLVKGASLPDPSGLDAVMMTGSPAGVYDDEPWIAPLQDFIRGAAAADVPQVGICFGHQILAEALGGKVVKSEKGWGVGRHTYEVLACPDFVTDGCPPVISAAVSHQDQVVLRPPGAEVIAASEFTPYAGLYYPEAPAFSFQCHPEFDDTFSSALYDLRRDRLGEAMTGQAISSLKQTGDHARLARWIGAFLTAHSRGR
ncbi:MAG: glutamine amidotransferase [Hyphomonas sp.]|uniref:type 1 glutamine amidotransferase n=1 Tax=Hyphomonas sp. TaxID=87 RepID=UPI003527503D